MITRIITAGITWLIGLLNPAAAFIKACKLIYDVVMFFVNNAERIAKFVNTIIDSVADIVRGNIGGVVTKIEDVLGQMVPILIGFLASVIGLGGIGQKIREIIEQAAEAGHQGHRLRDQDRPQAGRPDHPRAQGHQRQGQGQGRRRQGLGQGQGGRRVQRRSAIGPPRSPERWGSAVAANRTGSGSRRPAPCGSWSLATPPRQAYC